MANATTTRFDSDLDAHTAAAALCGMVEAFARHWFGRGEEHDEDLAVTTLTTLWTRSLGVDSGRQPHKEELP